MFQRLLECLGIANSFQPIGVSKPQYELDNFIAAWDAERIRFCR